MNIIVIIVTFNSEKTILGCLASLYSDFKSFKTVVVDCNSRDKTRQYVQQKFPQVEIINSKNNLGFAKANNIGIKYALKYKPDYILILNPDTIILNNFFSAVINEVKKGTKALYGPKIFKTKTKYIWSSGGLLDKKRYSAKLIGFNDRDQKKYNQNILCDFISGTCLLIPKELINYGLRFYEPYFLYYEDVEFCIKAKKLGFDSVYLPQANIIHFETSSFNEDKSLKHYYLARNHLLFVERNAPIKVQLREFFRLPITLYEHKKNDDYFSINGIKDYFMRKFGQYE